LAGDNLDDCEDLDMSEKLIWKKVGKDRYIPSIVEVNEQDKNKELRKMVREMLDEEDKSFSDWEIEFLDNMWKLTEYTERQANKIEQIYEKKMI